MSLKAPMKLSPADKVVWQLKRHGRMSIKELEAALGVTRTAVRQQLEALEAKGLVRKASERQGVGRPKGLYFLTSKGHRLFGREYEELLRLVLGELEAAEGATELRDLLGRISRKLADSYEQLPEELPLAERVASLVEQFTNRGHLAEAEAVAEGFDLRMYNCPYRELVSAYPAICEMERSMLHQLLGAGVKRSQWILDRPETHCAYTVVGSDSEHAATG